MLGAKVRVCLNIKQMSEAVREDLSRWDQVAGKMPRVGECHIMLIIS